MPDPLRGKTWLQIKEALARGEIRLPTSDELKSDLIIYSEASNHNDIFKAIRQFEENRIRECLGCWISELEPCLMYQGGAFIGLGFDGDLSVYPKVYVRAKDPRYIEWRTEDRRDDRELALAYSFEAFANIKPR